jgi:hypothetical protein
MVVAMRNREFALNKLANTDTVSLFVGWFDLLKQWLVVGGYC